MVLQFPPHAQLDASSTSFSGVRGGYVNICQLNGICWYHLCEVNGAFGQSKDARAHEGALPLVFAPESQQCLLVT